MLVPSTSPTKKRLVVLSDLWGREKSDWLAHYSRILKHTFDISYYDCCELGGVDKSDYSEDSLHHQFVTGGIEKAVNQLLHFEKDKVNILAFSVGGVIAWKFGLVSDKIESLVCVSSTRLRKEENRPSGEIMLYFGADDEYKPQLDWFTKMHVKHELISKYGHEVYMDAKFATELSNSYVATAKHLPAAK